MQIGITHSAAIGKAMAEWITEGETEWDLSAWDPRRFGDWATQDYTHARASEHCDLQYAIPYPHRNMRSGRPVQKTALYDSLVADGAVMGQIGGWERALWFETETSRNPSDLSFHDEPWHAAVREECRTVHEVAGRDAVIAQSEHPSEWEWIGLEVTAPSPDPLPSEPILADGEIVGYVTSGAKGIRTGKTLILGYIKRDAIQMGTQCSVSILGAPYPAVRHDPVQYDPENLAMKM